MMKSFTAASMLALTSLAGVLMPLAAAAQATPVGLWKTVDDSSKKEKSLVRISESGGVFTGAIDKLLDAATPADAVCEACTDERRGKPLVGLEIIRGVKKNADEAALWDGGSILDPNNGKTYKVRLKPVDGGKKLELRGYIGTPMIGRTQTWIRVE